MERKESRLAQKIDIEYRQRQWFQKELKFRKEFCSCCSNKKTNLCEIRKTIDGEYRCIYFEKAENKEE
jgi:hypothetical protein